MIQVIQIATLGNIIDHQIACESKLHVWETHTVQYEKKSRPGNWGPGQQLTYKHENMRGGSIFSHLGTSEIFLGFQKRKEKSTAFQRNGGQTVPDRTFESLEIRGSAKFTYCAMDLKASKLRKGRSRRVGGKLKRGRVLAMKCTLVEGNKLGVQRSLSYGNVWNVYCTLREEVVRTPFPLGRFYGFLLSEKVFNDLRILNYSTILNASILWAFA